MNKRRPLSPKNYQGFKEQKPKPTLLFLSAHQLLGPLQQASRILIAKVHTHELCQGRGGSREGSETPFLAGQGTQRREAGGSGSLGTRPWAMGFADEGAGCLSQGGGHPVWTQRLSFILAAQRTAECQPPTSAQEHCPVQLELTSDDFELHFDLVGGSQHLLILFQKLTLQLNMCPPQNDGFYT